MHFPSSLRKPGFPVNANPPPRKAVRAGEPGASAHFRFMDVTRCSPGAPLAEFPDGSWVAGGGRESSRAGERSIRRRRDPGWSSACNEALFNVPQGAG